MWGGKNPDEWFSLDSQAQEDLGPMKIEQLEQYILKQIINQRLMIMLVGRREHTSNQISISI